MNRHEAEQPVPFSRLAEEVATSHPRLGSHLLRAEQNRGSELRLYYKDHPLDPQFEVSYLDGLEALFKYLDEVHQLFRRHDELQPIAFLIERATGNFIVATDAALSRFNSVVFDAMRDTMEIQLLLRDFAYTPAHISEWIRADEHRRYARFSPKQLRRRHAQRASATSQGESVDYKLHSILLHVSPLQPLGGLAAHGIVTTDEAPGSELCFWEIFEHARRLAQAITDLAKAVSPPLELLDPKGKHPNLVAAWDRSQAMLAGYQYLMGRERGRDPSGDRRVE
jgi:hypothetical protein